MYLFITLLQNVMFVRKMCLSDVKNGIGDVKRIVYENKMLNHKNMGSKFLLL